MRRLIVWLTAATLVVVAVWLYRKPVTLAAATLLGRNAPFCMVLQVLRSPANLSFAAQINERMQRACRVVETDRAGFELWDTPRGRFWAWRGDAYLPVNLAEQERKVYGVGEQGVRAGDVVLDCGASVGIFTRAALAAGAQRVVAIEPAAVNLECLRRNLRDEIASGRVVLVTKGVWSSEGVLSFVTDLRDPAASGFAPSGAQGASQVPVTTIDRIVADLGLARVDFIKMDIEGSEREALQGARETLRRLRPRLAIASYHREDDVPVLARLVREIQPAYTPECGPCSWDEGRLAAKPEILFFR